MQRYNRLTEDKSIYVLDVIDNGDEETLTVIFGDRKRHEDIENTPENIKKFEEQMETQMDDALKRQPIYTLRALLATSGVIATGTGAVTMLSSFESLQNLQTNEYLSGTALLLGFGCSVLCSIREYSRVSELSKVKYRNNHAERFQNIGRYNHALDSSSAKIRELFSEEKNPLGILNIDRYSKRDLKKIITEINREEAIKARGITYVKTK